MTPNTSLSAIDDTATDAAEARLYEIAVLFPYPMGQKEEQQAIKEVENIFKEAGAKEVSKDVWGRRGLAYAIKGSTEGNFIIYHIEMSPEKMKEVNTAIRIVPGVLRHLMVKPPKGYQIVKYSAGFDQWMKTRESVEEIRKRERETELQQRVADQAMRKMKRTERTKTETPAGEAMSKEELGKKLDSLISDDSLGI